MDYDLEYRKIMDLIAELHELKLIILKFVADLKPKEEDEWLHISKVAKIFNRTERTIYTWVEKNEIPHRRFGGIPYFLKSQLYGLD